jgi:transcriptional regulator with XRE-family HTH domain
MPCGVKNFLLLSIRDDGTLLRMANTDEILRTNIQRFRLRSGRTKSDLCRSIGMSRTFWDDIESGNKEPSVSSLDRIAGALGVTVLDLLTEPRKAKRELTGAKR